MQVESEYVIHVQESTDFYTSLCFSLLASPWFPRPLGLVLWSVLHMLLVLFETLELLAMYSIAFAFAFSIDAVMLSLVVVLYIVVPLGMLLDVVFTSLLAVIVWIWLLISCNVPRREPGQVLAHYILTAGETLPLQPLTPPAEEPINPPGYCLCVCDVNGDYAPTAKLVKHLKLEAIP